MKIGIGSDHRGFKLKEFLKPILEKANHEVLDFGVFDENPADYPDTAFTLTKGLQKKKIERGILICGSGLGMSIAANKAKGVRAALCLNEKMAQMARNHNDANVLILAANFTTPSQAKKISKVWLKEEFAGGRHLRRVKKILKYESF
ncbi:MAG: ribose 5-phosphate isomerase B [bacterium]